ncbi:uncharacterized protein isoform X1 [Rhodnius prolixus]|uniref:uncharacterized protein isoform X1 n=2 Tax=Rhodnius prolixus TaxID=13249 RepID=UPI003D18ACBC
MSESEWEDYIEIRDDEELGSQADDDDEHDEMTLRRSKRHINKCQESMRSNKLKEHAKEYTKIWSEHEKKTLLTLLCDHGDENLEILAAGLPNKHVSQVKTYIRTISRRALIEEKNRAKKEELLELDKWINYLKVNLNEQVDDRIPYELFAASQELATPSKNSSNKVVDFQKAYEYLSALSVGRKIDIDDKTYYFVHSYLDWFNNSFVKNVLPQELLLLKSSLKKLKTVNVDNVATTFSNNEVLSLIFRKVITNELFSCKHFLRTMCKKVRHTSFHKGETYDRNISLLRAKLDNEPARQMSSLDSPEFTIVPFFNDVKFRNLSSYLWGALYNVDIEDIKDLM